MRIQPKSFIENTEICVYFIVNLEFFSLVGTVHMSHMSAFMQSTFTESASSTSVF